jgi:hypothetical protein
MSADEVRFRDLLASQLILTEDMWGVLVREGLTEESVVRLDFAYRANAAADADALVSFLRAETDYAVSSAPDDTGFRVEGTTRETTVNPEILAQWVKWMVAAGYRHGRCEFDGWGTFIPTPE